MTRNISWRQWGLLILTLAVLATSTDPAAGQGVLIHVQPDAHWRLPRPYLPRPPQPHPASYKIESLEISAKLADTTARVQVSQTFKNTGSGQLEACFMFPLPYDGAIDQLTLLVNGKEYLAKLLTKDEARRRYEEIVRSSRDPALLEWVGTGMFQTSVFPIPAGESRTVTLRYTQLCRKSHGLTDFLFPLSTAKYTDGALDKLSLRVSIESPSDIKNVYSPSHDVEIDRPDDRHAVVKLDAKNTVPSEDFRLFYDAEKGNVAASVVSYRPEKDEGGYFLLLATPRIKQPKDDDENASKTVIFVVDRSGSMSGEKMEQAKEALKFVLNNLRKGDTFNIVAYDSEIETFRPELEKFTDESRTAATGFVNGLYAGGSTNIDGALARALGMLEDSNRPTYVIFLTDGLPTVGETNEAKIVQHASKANDVRARMFTFGVGYDVNSRLLDKLAREHHGQSEYVRPDDDIEDSVSRLYRRIGAPVMTEVELAVDVEDAKTSDGPTTTRVYPKGQFDLYAGDQAVIVGRYRTPGDAKVKLSGAVGGKEQSFDFPAELVAKSDDDTNSFVAKLWATRRVGEIIDELDLKGHNEELVKELVDLATKHGILTPYTSFLADEESLRRDPRSRVESAAIELRALQETEGRHAFSQRAAKGSYQYAERAAAPAAGGFGGGGFGGRSGRRGAAPAAAEPLDAASVSNLSTTAGRGVRYYDAKSDKLAIAGDLISVGRKTLARRGDRWVDTTVNEEEEKSAQAIERYSRDYFDLVERHGKHVAQYLAIEDPVVIELDGKVYSW
jgi:Ca-activated chloride channel family protein